MAALKIQHLLIDIAGVLVGTAFGSFIGLIIGWSISAFMVITMKDILTIVIIFSGFGLIASLATIWRSPL